jgi:hypothetical protein
MLVAGRERAVQPLSLLTKPSRIPVCPSRTCKTLRALSSTNQFYLRAPRWGFLTRDCRSLAFLRFGLVMRNVPLPTLMDL